MSTVTVVDYGMGNIRSITQAFERLGATVVVSDDAKRIESSDRLVIPGQGAFGQAMERLRQKDLIEPLRARARSSRPLLGVCLGLQLLYERSGEEEGVEGLAIIPGDIEILPVRPGIKRPHMGWAPVEHQNTHPVLSANVSGEAFYFVHSYAARGTDRSFHSAYTEHGDRFIAAVAKDALVAVQFHPEKSQDAGEKLLAAWMRL